MWAAGFADDLSAVGIGPDGKSLWGRVGEYARRFAVREHRVVASRSEFVLPGSNSDNSTVEVEVEVEVQARAPGSVLLLRLTEVLPSAARRLPYLARPQILAQDLASG